MLASGLYGTNLFLKQLHRHFDSFRPFVTESSQNHLSKLTTHSNKGMFSTFNEHQ